MAVDPFQAALTDGRIFTEPEHPYTTITVRDFSIENFHNNIISWLLPVFLSFQGIQDNYAGDDDYIDEHISHGVHAMVDFACMILYNHLRSVVERFSIATRADRMNPRAPVSLRMEFPTWFSSLFSSIRPLDIPDGPTEIKVVYASSATTAANYYRDAPVSPSEPYYNRFRTALLLRLLTIY